MNRSGLSTQQQPLVTIPFHILNSLDSFIIQIRSFVHSFIDPPVILLIVNVLILLLLRFFVVIFLSVVCVGWDGLYLPIRLCLLLSPADTAAARPASIPSLPPLFRDGGHMTRRRRRRCMLHLLGMHVVPQSNKPQ